MIRPTPVLLASYFLANGLASNIAYAEQLATYDAQSKLLTLPVVQVAKDYWSVTLIDQGQYHFRLSTFSPFKASLPDSFASYDTNKKTLNVPKLSALGSNWQITFQDDGDFAFSLKGAVLITENKVPANDLEKMSPLDRFKINPDGTVTDVASGLQWMRCSLGQSWNGKTCVGNHLKLSMQEAAYAAFNTQFAGFSDWRLPEINELKSLIYCSTGKPAYWNTTGYRCDGNYGSPTLYNAAFPDSKSVYWSATPLQADPGEDNSLTVSFNLGHVYYSYFRNDAESARFVRGTSTIAIGPEVVGGFKESPCVTDICSTVPR